MDVFSAGCVIAELFREGAPLFTLSQLFKYREGELNPDGLLTSIEDVGVRVRIPPDDKVICRLIFVSPSEPHQRDDCPQSFCKAYLRCAPS